MTLIPWNLLARVAGPWLVRGTTTELIEWLRKQLPKIFDQQPTELQERVIALERINEAQAVQLRWLTVIALLSVAMAAVAIVALVIVALS